MSEIARGIAEGARSNGYQVDVLSTEDKDRPVTFFPYDLVLTGSPVLGFFKGKMAEDLRPYLQKCKRTRGKKAIAFVTPGLFGTTRVLKQVMSELEKLGCIVKNFVSLKNREDAFNFGKDL